MFLTRRALSRRDFLTMVGGASAAGVLAACAPSPSLRAQPSYVDPGGPQVLAAEARRPTTGRIVTASLTPRPLQVDLGGRVVSTWAYGPQLAAREFRVRVGDRLRVSLRNQLPRPTTVHWHGLALRNDMDGVPGLTQQAVPTDGKFDYDFVVPDAGTYFFHSHEGVQLDRGLYGPLVVEDPADPGGDVDQVLVLDDWLDGVAGTPDQQLATLRRGMSMGGNSAHSGMAGMPGMGAESAPGMAMPMSSLLGGDAADVSYPLHLINGRPGNDRYTLTAPTGGKVRLRLINAGSNTAYRVAVGGHRLTVVATDGRAVQPVEVDAVLIGMGERYDVELRPSSGVWPIFALAEGSTTGGAALLRTTDVRSSVAPDPNTQPAELSRQVLTYRQLRPAAGQILPGRRPDRTFTVAHQGSMATYQWSLGADAGKLDIRAGERVRLVLKNISSMWHPVHLHGHTFALTDFAGVRKDTVRLLPGQTLTIDLDADNPGRWMYHCHNVYHQSVGMMTSMRYLT